MKMIFGDENEVEHVLDLIRQDDQIESDTEPMPTARYLAGLLRAGLIADGVEAHQIADTSDIVNWFLVYESPQGSWHRAYAQCLATLMVYFFEPIGSPTAATDRLARTADFRRLEEECGHVLMVDRLRMATEEVGRKLNDVSLRLEQTNSALAGVSVELWNVKNQTGTVNKRTDVIGSYESIKADIEEIKVALKALQPKETDNQKAVRLMESFKREKAAYVARGEKFTAVDFHRRWAVKEGCGHENIRRLLTLARKLEARSGSPVSSTHQFLDLANFKKDR